MRYDTHDAVKSRHFVGYGRGIEAAEQHGAMSSHRSAPNSRSGSILEKKEKITHHMLEKILQSQYRAYLATASRVAKVHDIVNKMRVQYLRNINRSEVYNSNVDTTGVSAAMRRENQHIGSSQLLSRAYAYDPFYDADRKEETEKMKIDLRRREEVTSGIQKHNLLKEDKSMLAMAGTGKLFLFVQHPIIAHTTHSITAQQYTMYCSMY
jgi:hypothetical protein